MYDTVFSWISAFANYKIEGYYLCRMLVPFVLGVILWASRIMSSFMVKIFSLVIAFILYHLPDIVKNFM